jgi:8-oxo-dGTP diphosphatase
MPETDQKFNLKRYQVIPRTLIFLFDGNRVLLLKGRADKKIWAGKYNGLGGHIESGEDVLTSARRELHEEAGIANSHLDLCGVVTISLNNGNGIMLFVFKGRYEGEKLIESREGLLEWIEINKLGEIEAVEDLHTILPVVHRRKPGEEPFFARYHYNEDGKLIIKFSNIT